MEQRIFPDKTIFHTGDTVTFFLDGVALSRGKAVVRTNLGGAATRRAEVIRHTRGGQDILGLDWRDIELEPMGERAAQVTLPLNEVGIFEAKCCMLPHDGGAVEWPEGGNFRIKVESASSVAGNTIYCAFVRQFGANCERAEALPLPGDVAALDAAGFTVVPPSGTFRHLITRLDHIFGALGCRILQLLPVHPVPTVYGRMGRFGSPFAATDYFSVDPALADFDPKATPMEQFGELIDAVHARDGRIFMDIPVNHTGWASRLQTEHPEYFVRRADGTFESPGAWGVVWEDLCKLNYRDPKVHELMAEVFLFWCRRGVDGFRCDAGYMLPAAAWNYIVARVRQEYPDTVLLLEGLGGPLKVQETLLGSAGLNWGYSELFQNYSRDQIAGYFPYVDECSSRCGTLVNFAETHDNARLAATSETYARLRFLVAALLAEDGSFGFANGAEFFAREKIDVHGDSALNWNRTPNLVELIRKLNSLLADHPAFRAGSRVRLIQQGPGNVLAARRTPEAGAPPLLVLLNLDCDHSARVFWPSAESAAVGVELLTGRRCEFHHEFQELSYELAPGEGLCVSFDDYRIPEARANREPSAVAHQRADAMARRVAAALAAEASAGALAAPGEWMRRDPEGFIATLAGVTPPPVTHWRSAFDSRRRVMVPPGDILLVESDRRFRLELRRGETTLTVESSLDAADGRRIVLLALPENAGMRERSLSLRVILFGENGEVTRLQGELLQLTVAGERRIRMSYGAAEVAAGDLTAFASNQCGGVSFFPAAWGTIQSKYHAILAANANHRFPVDRHTMFTRCRAWINVNGYSQEIDLESLERFWAHPDNRARWLFRIPAGQGCCTTLEVEFLVAENCDAVKFRFYRRSAALRPGELADVTPVRLILRPDLEDRINHQLTKAFTGPERSFPAAVHPVADGFDFSPSERTLSLRMPRASFVSQPEWYYQVDLPAERYYGMEDKTDLFSPGYFEIRLSGGERAELTATVTAPAAPRCEIHWPQNDGIWPDAIEPASLLPAAMQRYVVRRDEFKTVIAGYPWFLDWGRDTLIVLRGLVSGSFREDAAAILRQFACFERNGTIPNMIRGRDDANRDTSDAPLYLIVATRDYVDAAGSAALLDADCAGRSLREVLRSIAESYQHGTPNGIRMDQESKLIFSPSHFTWMDTNFPAGTPREGYPIEIQALWYAALHFLGREEPSYERLAEQVAASVERLYFSSGNHCASDCLHASPGTPAAAAVADDHIRPNQLLALTLGAVRSREKQQAILAGCEELIVPGGIRSLADRPTRYRLPVERDGRLLNDPVHPYRGFYSGPEDTERKVAYHNGTVWSWPFPAYCEALFYLGGEAVRERALALLLSCADYLESGVPGQLPEVADGDAPHRAGGCLAQAWSESEFLRVYELLQSTVI